MRGLAACGWRKISEDSLTGVNVINDIMRYVTHYLRHAISKTKA